VQGYGLVCRGWRWRWQGNSGDITGCRRLGVVGGRTMRQWGKVSRLWFSLLGVVVTENSGDITDCRRLVTAKDQPWTAGWRDGGDDRAVHKEGDPID
jgi:hypothetical protein